MSIRHMQGTSAFIERAKKDYSSHYKSCCKYFVNGFCDLYAEPCSYLKRCDKYIGYSSNPQAELDKYNRKFSTNRKLKDLECGSAKSVERKRQVVVSTAQLKDKEAEQPTKFEQALMSKVKKVSSQSKIDAYRSLLVQTTSHGVRKVADQYSKYTEFLIYRSSPEKVLAIHASIKKGIERELLRIEKSLGQKSVNDQKEGILEDGDIKKRLLNQIRRSTSKKKIKALRKLITARSSVEVDLFVSSYYDKGFAAFVKLNRNKLLMLSAEDKRHYLSELTRKKQSLIQHQAANKAKSTNTKTKKKPGTKKLVKKTHSKDRPLPKEYYRALEIQKQTTNSAKKKKKAKKKKSYTVDFNQKVPGKHRDHGRIDELVKKRNHKTNTSEGVAKMSMYELERRHFIKGFLHISQPS